MHDVPGRIDIVIVVAGVRERFARMACETDDQNRRKKDPHLLSPRIEIQGRGALAEKAKVGRATLDHRAGVCLQRRVLALH